MDTEPTRRGGKVLVTLMISRASWLRLRATMPADAGVTHAEWVDVMGARYLEEASQVGLDHGAPAPAARETRAIRLRLLREAMGMTQADVAQTLGVTVAMISQMETARSTSARTVELWRRLAAKKLGEAVAESIWLTGHAGPESPESDNDE